MAGATVVTAIATFGVSLVTPVHPEPEVVVMPGRASGPLVRGLPTEITSGFDTARDALPVVNNGDTAGPEGNCLGMSLVAIDDFRRRTRAPWISTIVEQVLPRPPARPTTFVSEADPRDLAAAGLAQQEAHRNDGGVSRGRVPLSDTTPVRDTLERIAEGGDPEVLSIEGDGGAHAMVLHGYRDGALQIYDPNYPGEVIAWPWSPETGFGPHPRADQGPLYASPARHTTRQLSDYQTGERIEELRAACDAQAAECVGRYSRYSAVVAPAGESLELVGQASMPPDQRPQTVWLTVNGRPIGGRQVSRFGTFRAVVPPGLLRPGPNQVRVVGEDGSRFAGFADLTVVAPPELFAPRPAPPRPAEPARPTIGLAGSLARR